MTTIDQIKTLLQSGDVAGAEALCRKALKEAPDDAQLKILFGLCRQLQGDEETFRRIHDELAPEMAGTEDTAPHSEKVSLWRKYHKLWLSLIVGALVLGGTVVGVVAAGNHISKQFVRASKAMAAYAAPVMPEIKRWDFDCNPTSKAVRSAGAMVDGGTIAPLVEVAGQADSCAGEGLQGSKKEDLP